MPNQGVPMSRLHRETHRTSRTGWLRASVLGANDGIVSTASLILGVAAATSSRSAVIVAGLAGMVAGAMSMAAGEYVSVSSQADTEAADLERERRELAGEPAAELDELARIWEARGLTPALARQVSEQLTTHDALASHARDELGLVEVNRARPLQAAASSAIAFAVGAAVPLVVAALVGASRIIPAVAGSSLILLGALGWVAARVGGARGWVGALRVLFWGLLAMALTTWIGSLFGVAA